MIESTGAVNRGHQMAKKEPKKKPEKPAKQDSKKKDKKAPAGAPAKGGVPPVPNMQLTPEQEVQMQMEQDIKESNDPASRLKKLKSPLNVGGCLLNLLFLVVLTFALVYLILYFQVDKFNFVTVTKDMMEKLGVTGFFRAIGNWFKNLFAGKGGEEATELLRMILMRF